MRRWQKAVFAVMIVVTVGGAAPFGSSAGSPVPCVAPHRLRILDLGMLPDPVQQGQRVQLWAVTLQSDYSGECLAVLEVRDGAQIVGRRVQYLITPGQGRYTFQADPNYRFQVQDHCFTVLANVADAWALISPIDAQKQFCARYRPQPPPGGWSLK